MGNPIFSRASDFNRQPAYVPVQNQYGPQYGQAPGQQYGQQYGQPQWGPQQQWGQAPVQQPYQAQVDDVMTMDDAIGKTAITLLLVALVGIGTMMYLPDGLEFPAVMLSGIVGFITVMIVSLRRVVSPVAVLAYAVIEGVFVGAFTKVFEMMYPGIATQAVLATFAVAGATLAAYKFFNIQVTPKFRKMVFIATAGFAVLMLVNLVSYFIGFDLGLRSGGTLAIIAAVVGCGLAVMNLITDFDYVERGVASRAPARESWRAALGITVTMVWLYTELLRILSYLRR